MPSNAIIQQWRRILHERFAAQHGLTSVEAAERATSGYEHGKDFQKCILIIWQSLQWSFVAFVSHCRSNVAGHYEKSPCIARSASCLVSGKTTSAISMPQIYKEADYDESLIIQDSKVQDRDYYLKPEDTHNRARYLQEASWRFDSEQAESIRLFTEHNPECILHYKQMSSKASTNTGSPFHLAWSSPEGRVQNLFSSL